MTHATEWMALRAECERLAAENTRLREALREAAQDIYDWGQYAGDYYKKKWNLDGDVAKYRALADPERHAPGCLADKGGA